MNFFRRRLILIVMCHRALFWWFHNHRLELLITNYIFHLFCLSNSSLIKYIIKPQFSHAQRHRFAISCRPRLLTISTACSMVLITRLRTNCSCAQIFGSNCCSACVRPQNLYVRMSSSWVLLRWLVSSLNLLKKFDLWNSLVAKRWSFPCSDSIALAFVIFRRFQDILESWSGKNYFFSNRGIREDGQKVLIWCWVYFYVFRYFCIRLLLLITLFVGHLSLKLKLLNNWK